MGKGNIMWNNISTKHEDVLSRLYPYIGLTMAITEMMWIYDKENKKMIQREIKYVPGLYKIFNEILENAVDNKQRDPTMDKIKIDIDVKKNTISVWNNGKGIPVVIGEEKNLYIPTLRFGHFFTSSNFDDGKEYFTRGRNGLGAKLCNIFSNRFTVEIASKESQQSFKQLWSVNMSKVSEPIIKDYDGEDFTHVTFSPDFEKFGMKKLDQGIVDLIKRRAYDCAATLEGVRVILNGECILINNFEEYCKLHVRGECDDNGMPLKIAYDKFGPRWEVALTFSDTGYKQVSFVNSRATTEGGSHVEHVTKLIVDIVTDLIENKNEEDCVPTDDYQIKQSMWIFINCSIDNPTFCSKKKGNIIPRVEDFGSECRISDKFKDLMANIGIIESVMSFAEYEADSKSKEIELDGMLKSIDATYADTKFKKGCTLILTEGVSGLRFAESCVLSIKNGRDKFGIFPLSGKFLNVRQATKEQVSKNTVVNNLMSMLVLYPEVEI